MARASPAGPLNGGRIQSGRANAKYFLLHRHHLSRRTENDLSLVRIRPQDLSTVESYRNRCFCDQEKINSSGDAPAKLRAFHGNSATRYLSRQKRARISNIPTFGRPFEALENWRTGSPFRRRTWQVVHLVVGGRRRDGVTSSGLLRCCRRNKPAVSPLVSMCQKRTLTVVTGFGSLRRRGDPPRIDCACPWLILSRLFALTSF